MAFVPPCAFVLQGSEHLASLLRGFDEKLQSRILERAARRSAKPAIQEIRAGLKAGIKQRRTGLLVKSIGLVVRNYRSSGTVFVAVGAKRSVMGSYNGKKVWPVKYFHLVDMPVKGQPGGYVRKSTGARIKKGRGPTEGLGVINRVAAGYSRKWQTDVANEIREEVNKELAKEFG
jgi:hypothetical protein